MITRNQFFHMADSELNKIFGNQEVSGDQETANKALRHFYTGAMTMMAYIHSTGKAGEYESWLNRFNKANPGAVKTIANNIELELE